MSRPKTVCTVSDCDRPTFGRGMCQLHYSRWYRQQTVAVVRPSVEERFWGKVNKTETCWLWTDSVASTGYGQFGITANGRTDSLSAHRLAWQFLRGHIPAGLVLDHLCRVPACVNPDHLEPVTQAVNVQRAQAFVSHCPNGHEYDALNTYTYGNKRKCRACAAAYQRQRRTGSDPRRRASMRRGVAELINLAHPERTPIGVAA